MRDSDIPNEGDRPVVPDENDAPTERTTDTHRVARVATGAIVGAVGGTVVGLNTMIVGPVGAALGALIGAELAEVSGHAVLDDAETYAVEHDEHYRALWESDANRPADAQFDRARPAYRFGHVAAFHPTFVGRDFVSAEPHLQALWERDFRARHGEWTVVRKYVCDAYGHSRGENYGIRRDRSVIGTGGSAVDPLELARARAGLASRADSPEGDEPLFPTDLAGTAPDPTNAPAGGTIGEGAELPADRIYDHRAPR